MDIETVKLKAKRISTVIHGGDLIVNAYRPTLESIRDLSVLEHNKQTFRLDLKDETGDWTAAAKWNMQSFVRSDDNKVITAVLVRAS